tara:strand:+ start:1156 stop:1497 length:342 start_codon:yes stop_codon:yes gene_type:complete
MNKYTTSLELSKKLKELGVKQESEFYWVYIDEKDEWVLMDNSDTHYEKVSAYISSELGEMLPLGIKTSRQRANNPNSYECCQEDFNGFLIKGGDTESEAKGRMLIYLLENNLI